MHAAKRFPTHRLFAIGVAVVCMLIVIAAVTMWRVRQNAYDALIRGQVYADLGVWKDAVAALDIAIAAPSVAEVDVLRARAIRGISLEALGRDEDALADLAAVALSPNGNAYPDAFVVLGALLSEDGDYAGAAAAITIAEARASDLPQYRLAQLHLTRVSIARALSDDSLVQAAAAEAMRHEGFLPQGAIPQLLLERSGTGAVAEADAARLLAASEINAPAVTARLKAEAAIGLATRHGPGAAATAIDAALAERALLTNETVIALLEARAHHYMLRGDEVAALAVLEEVLALEATVPWVYALRARVLYEEGDRVGAIGDATTALALDSTVAEAMFVMGAVAFDAGRLSEAREWLDGALEAAPSHSGARARAAMLHGYYGHNDRAQANLAQAVAEAPAARETLRARAFLAWLDWKWDECREAAEQAIQLGDERPEPLALRAACTWRADEAEAQLADAELAARAGAESWLPVVVLAQIQLAPHQSATADAVDRTTASLLERWPDLAMSHLLRGEYLYTEVYNVSAAMEAYDMALEHGLAFQTLLARGRVHLIEHDYAAAQVDLERAADVWSDHPALALAQSRLWIAQEDKGRARELLESLVEQRTDLVAPRLLLASLVRPIDPSLAWTLLHDAIALDRLNLAALLQRVRYYRHENDISLAQREIELIIGRYPTLGEAYAERAFVTLQQTYASTWHSAALADIEDAIQLAPYLATELAQPHAVLLLDQLRVEDALTVIEAELPLVETSAPLSALHGTILLKLGRLQDAIRAFDRAVSINGDGTAFRYKRGLANLAAGYCVSAMDAFEAALMGGDIESVWLAEPVMAHVCGPEGWRVIYEHSGASYSLASFWEEVDAPEPNQRQFEAEVGDLAMALLVQVDNEPLPDADMDTWEELLRFQLEQQGSDTGAHFDIEECCGRLFPYTNGGDYGDPGPETAGVVMYNYHGDQTVVMYVSAQLPEYGELTLSDAELWRILDSLRFAGQTRD